ncbi:MAG: pirin family protein [Rhodocyclaceae bacterium]
MSTARSIANVLTAKPAALAGISVWRALPRRELRRVGPFVFLDHFGPVESGRPAPDYVGPHPHTGLQTVTYLFSGEIEHRDSLGTVQRIRPGAANWMTAGRGIVHAEDPQPEAGPRHGVQAWVGLPPDKRDIDPAFHHFDAEQLPVWQQDDAHIRLLAGSLGTQHVPAPMYSSLVYAEIELNGSVRLAVDATHELALYVAEGAVRVGDSEPQSQHALVQLGEGDTLHLSSQGPARLMLLGGEHLPEPTTIWWNFITDTVESGRALQARWEAGGFPQLHVPGHDDAGPAAI